MAARGLPSALAAAAAATATLSLSLSASASASAPGGALSYRSAGSLDDLRHTGQLSERRDGTQLIRRSRVALERLQNSQDRLRRGPATGDSQRCRLHGGHGGALELDQVGRAGPSIFWNLSQACLNQCSALQCLATIITPNTE